MNELKNLTNAGIGKLDKLVLATFFFYILWIITSLLYKIDKLLLKQNKFPVLDIAGSFIHILTHYVNALVLRSCSSYYTQVNRI